MKEKRRYTQARERAEKQSTGYSSASLKLPEGATMFKPKVGTMLIDILPYEAGEGNPWAEPGNLHWERTYYVHKGIGANGDTVVCPRMSAKERCPICEARLKLMKEGDEDNEELVKDLSPKQRQLFNVINRKDPDKGVQIWDFSYFLFGKTLDARLRNSDDDDGWDKFFFLEDGLTLKIGFAEKSFGGHAFCEVETIDFKSREDYDDDILKEVHCLDEVVVIEDYDKLKKMFLEAREAKDDDDDEEEKPRSKRREVEDDDDEKPESKRSSTRAERQRQEEEETEEDEPKAKKKAPKDDDDDWGDFEEKKSKKDDDDEPEEREEKEAKRGRKDDDEDEPPRRKRREEPEDEEEETPRKRRHKDEEENESEQPEDDEPPRRKRKDDDDDEEKPDHRSKKQKGLKGDWGDIEDEEEPKSKKKRKDDDE